MKDDMTGVGRAGDKGRSDRDVEVVAGVSFEYVELA
jgi:hypothetical protein